RLVASEVGALGAPDLLAGGAHAVVLLRFRLLTVAEPLERAVTACADEAYGRSSSAFNELFLRTWSSPTPERWWCRSAQRRASAIVALIAGAAGHAGVPPLWALRINAR